MQEFLFQHIIPENMRMFFILLYKKWSKYMFSLKLAFFSLALPSYNVHRLWLFLFLFWINENVGQQKEVATEIKKKPKKKTQKIPSHCNIRKRDGNKKN